MKKMLVLIAAVLSVIVQLLYSQPRRQPAPLLVTQLPQNPQLPQYPQPPKHPWRPQFRRCYHSSHGCRSSYGSHDDRVELPGISRLSSPWQAQTGYALKWNAVNDPGGQVPASYTIQTLQLNGVKVDQFTTTKTRALEMVRVVPACILVGLTRPMCGPTIGLLHPRTPQYK